MLQDQIEMEDRGMESGENMMSPCSRPLMDRRVKPQTEQDLKCPRCDSTNTKFCYYNNYSLTQPRHFCKTCRRYWTKGGSLRSVPVGGGCRKNNKRTNNNNNKRNGDQPCSTSSATAEGSTVPVTGHDLSPNPSFGAAANNYVYYNEAAAAEELGINYGRSLSLGESAYVGGEFGQGFQSCIPTNLTNLQSLQYSNFLGAASADHGFSRQPVNRLGAMNIADLSSIIDSKPLTSNTPFEGDVSHPYINNSNSNIGLDHTTGQSHSHSRLLMQQHQKNNSYEEGSQGLYEGGYWNPGAWPDLSAYGLPNVNNSM